MRILMMTTTKKAQFINFLEAEAGDVVISKLKMDGNVLNVDLPCPKGNICEVHAFFFQLVQIGLNLSEIFKICFQLSKFNELLPAKNLS